METEYPDSAPAVESTASDAADYLEYGQVAYDLETGRIYIIVEHLNGWVVATDDVGHTVMRVRHGLRVLTEDTIEDLEKLLIVLAESEGQLRARKQ